MILLCVYAFDFLVALRVSYTNYSKRKRIIRVKACCCGVYMFKNMRLVILFDMLLNPSFKMTTSFANVFSTTASQIASKIAKYTTEKIIFTDEKLQPTYIQI